MAAVTKFYIVVPTPAEIIAANGNVNVQVFTDRPTVNGAVVKGAIVAGAQRVVMEAVAYADPELDPATVTAQLKTVA